MDGGHIETARLQEGHGMVILIQNIGYRQLDMIQIAAGDLSTCTQGKRIACGIDVIGHRVCNIPGRTGGEIGIGCLTCGCRIPSRGKPLVQGIHRNGHRRKSSRHLSEVHSGDARHSIDARTRKEEPKGIIERRTGKIRVLV